MDGFGHKREKPWRESAWQSQIDEVRRLTKMGKTVIAKFPVKASTGLERLQKFCFASYLLVADGQRAYFYPALDIDDDLYDPALYKAALGAPEANYTRDSGKSIYRRKFISGLVLVNPSGNTYQGVSLGRTYRTLTGSTLSSFTLKPYSAEVLLK